MFLKGNFISIRALEPSDAEILYAWENDQTLWDVSLTQTPFSKFVLDEFVNTAHNDIYTNKQLRLMIDLLATGQTIGAVDLFEFEPQHGRCGIGIYIQKSERQKGCGAECLKMIKDYCFSSLHLKQLFAHVNASNTASLSLFEKAGFEKAGLKKCWNKKGLNTYEDVWFMQYLNQGA